MCVSRLLLLNCQVPYEKRNSVCVCVCVCVCVWERTKYFLLAGVIEVKPIADRVAQNLKIISKNFQFSTRRTRIYYLLLSTNRKHHVQNPGLLKEF